MSRRPQIPDEVLNAYVDGALSPAGAADLASRALTEPDLAARIARLHGLKAGVSGLAMVHPAPPLPAVPVQRLWRFGLPAALVAGLGALTLGFTLMPAPGPMSTPAASPDLAAHHDAWVQAAGESEPQAPDWLTGVMAGAGLRLVHAAPLPDAGHHLAFVGRNACRISLFERPGAGTPADPVLTRQDDLLGARWHSGRSDFVLIARDMNPDRFATIASALASASQTRDRPGPDQIASLAAARQPCLG